MIKLSFLAVVFAVTATGSLIAEPNDGGAKRYEEMPKMSIFAPRLVLNY